jgi:hypothetical protein
MERSLLALFGLVWFTIVASPLALATHSWLQSQDSMTRHKPVIPTEYSVDMQWPGDQMRAGTFSYLPTWASLSRFGRHTTRVSITGRLKCGKGELQASKLTVAPLQNHDCRRQGILLAAVARPCVTGQGSELLTCSSYKSALAQNLQSTDQRETIL